jgi:seryl-tRNA synthetase
MEVSWILAVAAVIWAMSAEFRYWARRADLVNLDEGLQLALKKLGDLDAAKRSTETDVSALFRRANELGKELENAANRSRELQLAGDSDLKKQMDLLCRDVADLRYSLDQLRLGVGMLTS